MVRYLEFDVDLDKPIFRAMRGVIPETKWDGGRPPKFSPSLSELECYYRWRYPGASEESTRESAADHLAQVRVARRRIVVTEQTKAESQEFIEQLRAAVAESEL